MNGILIINKPKGKSSFSVVNDIRKILKIKKVGHCGTLDLLAEGVLPICIGEATKLVDLIISNTKTYDVILKLGEETDTLDLEGKVIKTSSKIITKEEFEDKIPYFLGKILQTPPIFSAIKKNGVPLYKYARRGEAVDIKEREVYIEKIDLNNFSYPYVDLSITCSKGMYVRSLVRDIAQSLGSFAHVTSLKRTRVGSFLLKDAICLDNFNFTYDYIYNHIINPLTYLESRCKIYDVDRVYASKLSKGIFENFSNYNEPLVALKCIAKDNNYKLLAIIEDGKLKKVFNYKEWL